MSYASCAQGSWPADPWHRPQDRRPHEDIEAAFALPLARANQIRGQLVLHAKALPDNPRALTRKAIEMGKDGDAIALLQ